MASTFWYIVVCLVYLSSLRFAELVVMLATSCLFLNIKFALLIAEILCFFKNNYLLIFILDCAGSLLLHRLFSSCSEQGQSLTGFLLQWLLLLQSSGCVACGLQQLQLMGSVVTAHRLQSTGSVVVGPGLSCSKACGIFRSEIEPVSPALAGGFFTTEPPGKPLKFYIFKVKIAIT